MPRLNDLTEDTDPPSTDYVLVFSATSGSDRKSTIANLPVATEADLSSEAASRSSADTAEATARAAADTAEATARAAADTTLQTHIDTEATTRSSADGSLSTRLAVLEADPTTQTLLTAEATARAAADSAEATARAAGDATLQAQIDSISGTFGGDYLGPVASQAAMTSLVPTTAGDFCLRTDVGSGGGTFYVWNGSDHTQASNWNAVGTGAVVSVDGRTGTVTLSDLYDAAGAATTAQAYAIARAHHTGTQTASTISDFNTAVRTNRLDQMAAPTGSVSAGSQKITSLADATAATDALNRQTADARYDATGAASTVQGLAVLKANNLSDVTASTARTNLGLGTAAVVNTGTSSGNVPTVAQADARYDAINAASAVQSLALLKASNLSDLADASTARDNLGIAAGYGTGDYVGLVEGLTLGSSGAATANRLAIQAAIDAAGTAGGGRVYLPAADDSTPIYVNKNTNNVCFEIPDGVYVIGAGMDSTWVVQANSSNADAIFATSQWTNNTGSGAATCQRDCGIAHMTVDYNWQDKISAAGPNDATKVRNTPTTANQGYGWAGATYRGEIVRVKFTRTYMHGLYMDTVSKNGTSADGDDALQNHITSVTTEYTGGCGIHLDDLASGGGNLVDGWITDCVVASPNQRNLNNTDGGTAFTHNDRYGHGLYLHNGTGWVVRGLHVYGAYTHPAAWTNFVGNRVKNAVWSRNANGFTIVDGQLADFGYSGTADEYCGVRLSLLNWRTCEMANLKIYTKEWNTAGNGTGSSTYFGIRVNTAAAASSFTASGISINSESNNSGGTVPGTTPTLTCFKSAVSGSGTFVNSEVSGWGCQRFAVDVAGTTAALAGIYFDGNAFQNSTAAPTTGTHAVGYKVWNSAPASGGTPGWVCTTAGTPGTFKAMANLA